MFIHEITARFVTILIYSINRGHVVSENQETGKHNFPRGEFLPKIELLFPIMPFESCFPSGANPMA